MWDEINNLCAQNHANYYFEICGLELLKATTVLERCCSIMNSRLIENSHYKWNS